MKRAMIIVLMALLVGGVGIGHAYTVDHQPGADTKILDVSTMVTTGDTMGGLGITVFFADGGYENVAWAGSGDGQSGGASGNGWSLTLSGNSWYAPWVFDSSVAISGITFKGLSGGVVFDVVYPEIGTPNSDVGSNYDPWGYESIDVTATYRDRVHVNGDPWYGDLYANLGIVFNDAEGFTGHYEFYSDTDNVSVPIPSTILLLGGGLLGLVGWRKRKK